MRKTKAQREIEARIELAYRRVCSGVQIDLMDIGRVFRVGETAVAAGATDTELERALVEFVNTVRRN